MTDPSIINAKFIPTPKSTPLPELFALRAKAKEQLAELMAEKRYLRSSLAKKIFSLRKKAWELGRRNGARQEQQALIKKALEVDLKSKQIIANSHRQGLETIKNICLSVFGKCPYILNEILKTRLDQCFRQIPHCGFSKIIVATGSKSSLTSFASNLAEVEESSEMTDGSAILESKSGKIEINVIDDLREAFLVLEQKLLDEVERSQDSGSD